MNKVIETVVNRRSCKNYKSDPVAQELIDEIEMAGLHAPSGMNKQPTIILEVNDYSKVRELAKLNGSFLPSHPEDPFYNAPVVLIVLADRNSGTYLYDGSLVMENMMIAASSLGLGSCWVHRAKEMFESEEGRALLRENGIPDSYEGIGNCLIGYPNVQPEGTLERKNRVVVLK